MPLISLQFGLFFLVLLAVYYIVPLKSRWAVLLFGSAAFYLLSATPYTILYLIFSVVSVYLCARYIQNQTAKHKKATYLLTIGGNVALLALLKYVNGFWSTGARLFSFIGIELPPFAIEWLAPLGISFYTLQLISYLTDVYWDISPAQKNPAKIALFASYFPSISSGPILRYNQVEGELFEGHKASYRNVTFGIQRMLWGLFKKMIIAERMMAVANPIFSDINTYNGFWLWLGVLAVAIQIYADFSGNMDFIIGASECFGVKLPENFRQPFFSFTIQEFFQRWHITLGTWLKDYVMYPLLRSQLFARIGKTTKKRFGKKAAKILPTFAAMFVLWLANGIWHSPYPKFLVTAMWFWFAVTAGQLLEPIGCKIVKLLRINTNRFIWRIFKRLRTFAVFLVGALFFSSSSVMTSLIIAKRAVFDCNTSDLLNPDATPFLELCGGRIGMFVLILSLALLTFVESYQNRGGSVRQWLSKQTLLFRWAVFLVFIFSILLFGVYGPEYDAAKFIYAGF